MNKTTCAILFIVLPPILFFSLNRFDPKLINSGKCISKILINTEEKAKTFAFNFWIEKTKLKPWDYSNSRQNYGSIEEFLTDVEKRGMIHIRSDIGIWTVVVEMFEHYPAYYSLNLEFNRCGEVYKDFAV